VVDGVTGGAAGDRVAIDALLSRYPFLVDQGKHADISQLFTADGIMEGPVGEPGRGRAGIDAFFRDSATKPIARPLPRLMRHHITSQHIEVDGDTAESRSYFMALTDEGIDHWGRYRDDLRRVDGEWLINRRTLKVDGFSPGSWWEHNVTSG
jgi:hypothetical protein